MSSQAKENSANEKIKIQDIWISLTILLNMSLLQQYFAWDFSKKVQVRDWLHSRLQSLNHDPLDQSSIKLCHGTKTSCLGVLTRLPISNSLLLSQHPFGESIILLFVKGSLVKPVSVCSGTALVTAQLSHWKKEDDL